MADSSTPNSPTPSVLDRVAEAICAATSAGSLFPWGELSEPQRDSWRRMAQAAIDALELTEHWGAAIALPSGDFDANANICHSLADAQKLLKSLNAIYPDDRRCIVSRLTNGPWRAEGGEH